MKKNFKVISSFGFKQVYIEHFDSFEAALAVHKKNCENKCVFSYLLEMEVTNSGTGDSINKILEISENHG